MTYDGFSWGRHTPPMSTRTCTHAHTRCGADVTLDGALKDRPRKHALIGPVKCAAVWGDGGATVIHFSSGGGSSTPPRGDGYIATEGQGAGKWGSVKSAVYFRAEISEARIRTQTVSTGFPGWGSHPPFSSPSVQECSHWKTCFIHSPAFLSFCTVKKICIDRGRQTVWLVLKHNIRQSSTTARLQYLARQMNLKTWIKSG